MSVAPRLLVGPGVSMKKALQAALAVDGPPFLLTTAAYQQVRAECGGSDEVAWRWLAQRAKYGTRPLLVNIEQPNGESTTVVLAPHGWSQERLAGYAGGLAETLEQELGEVARIWNPAGATAS